MLFWKRIFLAGAIILSIPYTFTTTLPKSSQRAKERLIKRLFGNNIDIIQYGKEGL